MRINRGIIKKKNPLCLPISRSVVMSVLKEQLKVMENTSQRLTGDHKTGLSALTFEVGAETRS